MSHNRVGKGPGQSKSVWSPAETLHHSHSLSPALFSNKLQKPPSCFISSVSPDPKVLSLAYLLRADTATASFAKPGEILSSPDRGEHCFPAIPR